MSIRTIVVAVFALLLGVVGGVVGAALWPHRLQIPFLASDGRDRVKDEQADEHRNDEDKSEKSDGGTIRLSSAALKEAGIEIAEASGGELVQTVELPGEVELNANHVAHIVPRVAGVVRRVDKNLGDEVRLGEVMAVLDSRELAEAKAAYLAAKERLSLAQATFKTSEDLKAKKILPELDYLNARKQLAEAEIELRVADNKLYSLGLSEQEISAVPRENGSFSNYELRAPFSGTVIQKHLTLGESVNADSDVFMLADLSTVWVNLTVYRQYLPLVQVGQPVAVESAPSGSHSSAAIDYVSPVVEESTRTVIARLTLPNPERRWRPGLFVSARVRTNTTPVSVLVPKAALQTINGGSCVFVETHDGFKVRPVTVGRSDGSRMEISEGLTVGERYVSANAFTVKSELEKAGFGD